MTQAEIQQRLPVYLDGELSPGERAEIEAALADSPALRAELERWKRFNDSLARCGCHAGCAPRALAEGLRRRLGGGRASQNLRIGAILAIAAAVALTLWLRPSLLDRTARELTGGGTVAAGLAVAPGDLEHVWHHCGKDERCRQRLGVDSLSAARQALSACVPAAAAPDLSDRGFQYRGCCECFPGAGHPRAVHVFYRHADGSRVVSVFTVASKLDVRQAVTGPQSCRDLSGYQEAWVDGVSVVKWCGGDVSFILVADLPLDELRQIARVLAAAEKG